MFTLVDPFNQDHHPDDDLRGLAPIHAASNGGAVNEAGDAVPEKKRRRGRVVARVETDSAKLGLTPQQFLERLRDEGATHLQIAEHFGCTRAEVGTLSVRYGVKFPGARRDVDQVVRDVGLGSDFADFYQTKGQNLTQSAMAGILGLSLSTVKRRIYEIEGKCEEDPSGSPA